MPQSTSLSPPPALHALLSPSLMCVVKSRIDGVDVGDGEGTGLDEGTGVGLGDSGNTERILPDRFGRQRDHVIDRTHIADRTGRRHITPGKTGTSGPGAAGGGS
ncbi:hypothetical protein Pve01_00040 [Planomonospora venezuelensis]|nr:hypothetical protein Pve01_00040 [Planomonospora venezuelensis]